MTGCKLSINRACAVGAAFLGLLSAATVTAAFLFTRNSATVWLGLLFILLVFICVSLFVAFLRRKLVLFSDRLCETIDNMLDGASIPPQAYEEENLFYKINHRLVRLYEVMRENRESVAKDRADLQELISDISHQVKTPIANLQMVNATLLEQPVTEEKRQEFLQASSGQLEKLDFLMQAMIKTSRLETGVIALDRKVQPIYNTVAAALGGILLNVEKKNIHVNVECPPDILLAHDKKWTSEALFNILDNAVKYTPEGGTIQVSVQSWELYVKIDITDSGKGIAESRQGMIFKRFYREKEVHDVDGIGIGLYLAREIITMQGGYIKVTSTVGSGSTFSVFLQGKIYGIVGRNGSGKTVLFKTMIGFLKPTSGRVIVGGKEIGRDTDFADNIGIIIETPGFLSSYSGYKNLEYLVGIKNIIGKKEIKESMERVGLDPNSKKKVGKYSLGMRQRLGIAQAIMENPDILILDEPMNGLDNQGVEDVREILLNLKDEGKSIILASHNKEDIEVLCDEVYEMDHGKLTVFE